MPKAVVRLPTTAAFLFIHALTNAAGRRTAHAAIYVVKYSFISNVLSK